MSRNTRYISRDLSTYGAAQWPAPVGVLCYRLVHVVISFVDASDAAFTKSYRHGTDVVILYNGVLYIKCGRNQESERQCILLRHTRTHHRRPARCRRRRGIEGSCTRQHIVLTIIITIFASQTHKVLENAGASLIPSQNPKKGLPGPDPQNSSFFETFDYNVLFVIIITIGAMQ